MPDAKLSASLSVDNREFEKGLKKSEKEFDKFSRAIEKRGDKILFTLKNVDELRRNKAMLSDVANQHGFLGNAPGGAGRAGSRGGRAGMGGGGPGTGLLQASYFVDDMQYGLRGVMNNIPGLVAALGGGAGLAGALGIAAVAAGTLGPKLLDLATGLASLKEATAEAEKFVAAMEEKEKNQRTRMQNEAREGTPAAQERLVKALAAAADKYASMTARAAVSARVGEHGRAGRDALPRARIESKDIPQHEKTRELGELDLQAQAESNAAQREGMKSQMEANVARAWTMENAATEAARRVQELEQNLKAIPDEKGADPTRRAAELRLEAGRVDADKARAAFDEINAEVLRANGALGQELNAITKRHTQEEEAARMRLKAAADRQFDAESAAIALQHKAYADEQVALGETADKRETLLQQTREQLGMELSIATLRAQGNEPAARRLENYRDLIGRTVSLEEMGFAADEARKLALGERVASFMRETAPGLAGATAPPRLSRSGRPRIGSPDGPTAAPGNAFRGIDAWRRTQRSSLYGEKDAYIGAIDGAGQRRENRREMPRNTREVRQAGGATEQWGPKFIEEIKGLRQDLAVLTKNKSEPLRSGK